MTMIIILWQQNRASEEKTSGATTYRMSFSRSKKGSLNFRAVYF
jgi:hypothetical protein